MDWKSLASELFPKGYDIVEKNDFLVGTAVVDQETITVIGTTNHAEIGIELCLAQSEAILKTIVDFPKRSILILVDTTGQRLRHVEEMLGIHRAMAHLGKTLNLARQNGHKIIGLVYDQALSGGFITSGLIADCCYALKDTTIRVMGLPAMARITKVPENTLKELSKINPVFAPGPENYLRMGGIHGIWEKNLAFELQKSLKGDQSKDQSQDRRALLGFTHGGRNLAHQIIEAILYVSTS